jgi:hypothetical protein
VLLTAIANRLKNGDLSRNEAEAQIGSLLANIWTEAEVYIGQVSLRPPRTRSRTSREPATPAINSAASVGTIEDSQLPESMNQSRLNGHALAGARPKIPAGCLEDCDNLHNVRRAARLSGFSVKHLYRMMAQGLLPYEQDPAGDRMIRHSKLREIERTRRPLT